MNEKTRIKKLREATIERMKALGTWREQFTPAVEMYAKMKRLLERLEDEFDEGDCQVVEEYTNKAGATNMRKTALYSAIAELRRDVSSQEDRLGLSPAGMKRINEAEMKKRKAASKLDSALERLGKS